MTAHQNQQNHQNRWILSLVVACVSFALLSPPARALPDHPAGRGRKLPANIDPKDPRWVLMLGDRARARLPESVRTNAVQEFGLKACAVRPTFLKKHDTHYSFVIPSRDRVPFTVADQKSSGRCWIFATDRVIDSILSARGIKASDVSPSFINYHSIRDQVAALLERAASSPSARLPELKQLVDSRGWSYVLSEGGWMSWAVDGIKKHGLVPESAMPTKADGASSSLLFARARELVVAAYQAMDKAPTAAARQGIAREYLGKTEQLLNTLLGRPPEQVKVRGANGRMQRLSPQDYMRQKLQLSESDFDMITLIDHPALARDRRILVDDGLTRPAVACYNLSMKAIEQATRATLRSGVAVWFATNASFLANPDAIDAAASKQLNGKGAGVLSRAAFDYDLFVPSAPRLDKGTRMDLFLGTANHAMALVGYDVRNTGKGRAGRAAGARQPVKKWLAENSWGPDAGDHGMVHVYDDAFRDRVEFVTVPRAMVPKALLERMDDKPAIEWRASE